MNKQFDRDPGRRAVFYLVAAALMLLAAWLRFKGLTVQSLWFDEIFTAYGANPARSLPEVLEGLLGPSVPLFFWSLNLWFKVFGFSDVAGRSLTALLGVLGVWAAFFAVRNLAGRWGGLLALGALSVNSFHIYYSQEVRPYSLVALLSVPSIYYFLKIGDDCRFRYWVFWVLANAALAYTQLVSLVFIAAQYAALVFLLSLNRRPLAVLGRLALSAMALVVLSLPISQRIIATLTYNGGTWRTPPGAEYYQEVVTRFFEDPLSLVVVVFLLLVAAAAPVVKSEDRTTGIVLKLLLVMFLTMFVVYTKSLISTPAAQPKYVITLLLCFLILCAIGIERLRSIHFRGLLVLIVVASGLTHLFYQQKYFETITKDQWRELVHSIGELDAPVYTTRFQEYIPTAFELYTGKKQPVILAQDYSELETKMRAAGHGQAWLIDKYFTGEEPLPLFRGKDRLDRNIVRREEHLRLNAYLVRLE